MAGPSKIGPGCKSAFQADTKGTEHAHGYASLENDLFHGLLGALLTLPVPAVARSITGTVTRVADGDMLTPVTAKGTGSLRGMGKRLTGGCRMSVDEFDWLSQDDNDRKMPRCIYHSDDQRHRISKSVNRRTHAANSTSRIFFKNPWFAFTKRLLSWEELVMRRGAMRTCQEEGICFPSRAMMTLRKGQVDWLTGLLFKN